MEIELSNETASSEIIMVNLHLLPGQLPQVIVLPQLSHVNTVLFQKASPSILKHSFSTSENTFTIN